MSTSRFMQIIHEHKVAILLALLASIIVTFPQVYFRIEHRNDGVYQGIELLPDSPWSARVREVQDGHPNFGNIYQKDGKDQPYLLQSLGSMAVGYMGKVFGLDINNTFLLSRFVLTFTVFMLFYVFVLLLSTDKLAALSSASVLVLAYTLLTFSGLSSLLHGLSPDNFLRIGRPVNPAMVYILLFGFLITFWLFYKKQDWRYGMISAILLGLNFYNYFYTWTFLYGFGGVLVPILLIRKKWREAIGISSVFIGALLVATPYIINLYRVTQHSNYEEVGSRIGLLVSHTPLFVGFTVIVALIIFLLGFPREDKDKYFFGLALLLAAFVTYNQQIITGKVLEVEHYHWFFNKPLAFILVCIAIFYQFAHRGLNSYRKPIAILIISVSILVGVFTQLHSYYYDRRDGGDIAVERQKYGPVMRWLNENAQKEAVVFANNEASHMTVIYTPLNVFYHRAALFSSLTATNTRVYDTVFAPYRLRGVGKEEVREVFFKERKVISGEIYGIHYRELLGSYEAIPDEKIEEVIAEYKKTLATPTAEWLKNVWIKYEVEYIVWDKATDPLWNLDKYKYLEKKIEFGDLVIYHFNP
ncbi:MAG: hypothetical protein AAB787_00375 [Patescibacteria group bacterium]